eukprot:CAMPEP_0118988686 /NCGR_PEP_ID=MMETSP1173-20130426/46655_1 /TAXON_ID=1034831 /ORGANISM="Rhizochromulina marina cf, Strain CCMP1243" /LENGTH=45 /DNA_ID= /DNA_START= /DNA_END= /DNA_ORIENTATION=
MRQGHHGYDGIFAQITSPTRVLMSSFIASHAGTGLKPTSRRFSLA